MAMFDYGRSSEQENVYQYHFFEPELAAGFYPTADFAGIQYFDSPVMTPDGLEAYGTVSYTKPLTQDEQDMYNLFEVPKSESKQQVTQQITESEDSFLPEANVTPVQDVPKEPVVTTIVLHDVPLNRVFPTKNPDYSVLSMPDEQSKNGYSNLVLPKQFFEKTAKGYDITLGEVGQTRMVSRLNAQKGFDQLKLSVEEIQQLYQRGMERQPAKKAMYLNSVPGSQIYSTKNPNYKVVSIPYDTSENGFLKLTVETSKIYDGRMGSNGMDFKNVNLGSGDKTVKASVQQQGRFCQIDMKVADVVAHYEDVKKQLTKKRQANVESMGTQLSSVPDAQYQP